jgi:predicted PurR-regulated permease PerM
MERPLPPPWDRFVPFIRRLAIWAMFFGILWMLRPFFFLVFLTFVFGYIQEHGTEALNRKIASRRMCSVLVFLALLGVLLGLGLTIGPALAQQAAAFPEDINKHLSGADRVLEDLKERYEIVRKIVTPDVHVGGIVRQIFLPEVLVESDDERLQSVLPRIVGIAQKTLWIGTSFFLALLFSFLVSLDYPRIASEMRSLHETRLRVIYDELSDSVFYFGKILGRALEARLVIALVNTALTAIGLSIMEIPNIAFLSAVVFVCSFIPVAGVFISSVPLCLAALTKSGLPLMLWAIVFVTIIHIIEAYILNPRIYGARLRMNPVLVLAILVISNHLFGIWGLVLGVPVVNYLVHVIRSKGSKIEWEMSA